MLVAGIALRNIGFINISGGYIMVAAVLRQAALVIILIRAGLELDPAALRKLKGMVFRLAVVPSVVEIASIAVLTRYLLDFPWIWGFLLGSVLAAVSPAVVIPCLFSLAARGYGTDKGIPTLIVAAASFDDIIAISVFGILISIIFSTGSLTVQIIRGPAGLVLGMVFGILWGLMARHIPAHSDPWVIGSRTILIGGGGLMAVLGSQAISFDGAGPLGCIVAAFVASCGWRSQGWGEEHNPVAENFALIWTFFQPILFSLIGTEINIFVLEGHTVGLGLVCLMLALLIKMLLSIMAAMGGGFSWKEKLFVSMAWFPKATVQAALGPIALDLARNLDAKDSIVLADKVLMVAVLAIMITAPLGAIVITLFGPRLLNKTLTSLP
nr:unnamed protein product [Timema californicum]